MSLKIDAGKVVGGTLRMLDKKLPLTKVDELTHKLRYSICTGCDLFDKEETACTDCGCEMNFKTSLLYDPVLTALNFGRKVKVSCPKNNW